MCTGNLVMNAIKNLKGWNECEKGDWYSVVWSCSYCSHHRFDESGDPHRAEYNDVVEVDFMNFLIYSRFKHYLPEGLLCKNCLPFSHSCVMYSAEGYVP